MSMIQLSTELRAKLASTLPEGYNLDDLRVFTGNAQILTPDALDPAEQTVMAKLAETAGPPKISDGKPTVLRVVAWMVHEGPNRNREGFVKEELQAIAPGLFRAPNFGVMDFNHSAVLPDFLSDGHPKVIGVWYKAEYAFDKEAAGGKGAWGVIATGMMFAWAYPEHANQMLGEQARSGKLQFSMACIPSSVEYARDDQGSWAILHNPVFFTVSALDVPPADADAVGMGTEDPKINDDALRQEAFGAGSWTDIPSWIQKQQVAVAAAKQGESMEILEQLKADKAAAELKITELTSVAGTKDSTIAELTAKVAELETKIVELETARASVVVELEAANKRVTEATEAAAAKVAELETQLKAAQDKVVAFEKAEADKAKAARLAARIAKLPDSFRAIHVKKDEAVRTRVESKWAEMEDAAWELYVTDELLGYSVAKMGFVARSAAEGVLTGEEGNQDSPGARARRLIKQ